MLRRALIGASESDRLRRQAERRAVTRRVVDRFVAGDTLADAVRVARELRDQGATAILDFLGESVDREEPARQTAQEYAAAIECIAAEGLDAHISVKPTALGLDVREELFRELVTDLCEKATAHGQHVAVDMEDSETTDATVQLVADLRRAGHDVGCAVQAYLRRTPADVAMLTDLGASLRICKGAYAEPEDLALQGKQEIRDQYLAVASTVLDSEVFGRFATHDDWLIDAVGNAAVQRGRDPGTWEFQMLYGVRPPLARAVVQRGHGLRIYIPYGTQWYPYFMRRLAERPANLTFFLRALVGRR